MGSTRQVSDFFLSVRFTLGSILFSFVGVVLVMTYTSPISLGPTGMLVAFAVFYVWFLTLFLGVAHIVRAVTGRHASEEEKQRTITARAVTLAAVWAFAPLICLALQSIGQLDVISIALVVLFEALAMVYIVKR